MGLVLPQTAGNPATIRLTPVDLVWDSLEFGEYPLW